VQRTALVQVGDRSRKNSVPDFATGEKVVAEGVLQEISDPMSGIANTVKLNQQTDERDKVVWDSYIIRTRFAQARPDYAEK
jgi:hypothetical protein